MYKQNKMRKTSIRLNQSVEGETIEQKIERVVNNREPITDGAPIIYTERKDGVLPGYNIRTDRFEVAIDAMDKVAGSKRAKREDGIKQRQEALDEMNGKKKREENGGAESTRGKAGEEGQSTE